LVRADAQRNRDELVRVAAAAFARGETDITLDRIAREAGVGIGTLYRHFPTRDDLLAAVYRSGLDEVCAAADALLATHAPADALRAWMDRYAEFVGTKRGMAESLRAMRASGEIDGGATISRINAAIARMLAAGAADGTLRADVHAEDVSASLVGMLWSAAREEPRPDAQIDRMLDLLFAGIRTPA
jgi:AcrR family transcriptional regulator